MVRSALTDALFVSMYAYAAWETSHVDRLSPKAPAPAKGLRLHQDYCSPCSRDGAFEEGQVASVTTLKPGGRAWLAQR